MAIYNVNRIVDQGSVSTVFGDDGIGTDGCGPCVGLACSGASRTVAHFDCDYTEPKNGSKEEKIEIIKQHRIKIKEKTKDILEEYFSEGRSYKWGYVTTSDDFTTQAIIETCKEFFSKNPEVHHNCLGVIIRKSGDIKALGFTDTLKLKKDGRNVNNGRARIRK